MLAELASELILPIVAQRAHVPSIPTLRLVGSNSDTAPDAPGLDGRNLPLLREESAVALAWSFPAGVPVHVRCARTWLGTLLTELWDEESAYRVELAAYEVIANASVHGAGTVRVAVRVGDEDLLMDVSDESPKLPAPRPAGAGDESGRGLAMVELLGGELAVGKYPHGKVVRLWIARTTPDSTLSAGWGLGGDDDV
jgi:anti-sigma regulatory factor (Ser/Thr protein kinase)